MDFYSLCPEIIIFVGAVLILMFDIFFAKKVKNAFLISHILALTFCAGAVLIIFENILFQGTLFNQTIFIAPIIQLVKAVGIVLLALVISLSLNFVYKNQKISSEFLALLMMSTSGGMILISANDFLTFYLGLELQALPLYLLASINRNSPKSSEAGIKYFILGCLASGMLLFGISMVYGFSGTTNFGAMLELYQANKNSISPAILFGFVLILSGMFFKVASAPFHMWSPDVYEGSPTIITTFFATVAKFFVLFALVRLFYSLIIAFQIEGIEKIFFFTAILSLIVGSFGAIFQKNLKRLLAYSSISHVAFVLLGISASSFHAFVSCILYITIYAIISIGTFAFLNLLISSKESEDESDEKNNEIFNISALSGLAKNNPVIAFFVAILMFSTAGIPPLAGFFSKFYIISSLIMSQHIIIAIIAVLFSVISAYYYLRIVKIMYFDSSNSKTIKIANFQSTKFILGLSAILNIVAILFINQIVSYIIKIILSI